MSGYKGLGSIIIFRIVQSLEAMFRGLTVYAVGNSPVGDKMFVHKLESLNSKQMDISCKALKLIH